MPYGELKINNTQGVLVDAFQTYGLSLSDGAKAVLLTPVANKERGKNKSRLQHGVRNVGSPEKKDTNRLSLPMHITAKTASDGLSKFNAFCQVLDQGTVNLWYSLIPNKLFRCRYVSCSNFTEFRNEMFKFTLKLDEDDPTDRALPQNFSV